MLPNEKQRKQKLKHVLLYRAFVEVMKIQQMLGLTMSGNVLLPEYLERTRKCGLAITAAGLIGKAETVKALLDFFHSATQALADAIPDNDATARITAEIKTTSSREHRASLVKELKGKIASNSDKLVPVMSSLFSGSTSVLLAIRADLNIETADDVFTMLFKEHSLWAHQFLKEQIDKLRFEAKEVDDEKLDTSEIAKRFW